MIRTRRGLPGLGWILLAAMGCGAGSGGGSAGLDSPDFPIELAVETVYTVGAVVGEPWETFGNVSSLAFDAGGARGSPPPSGRTA